MGSNLPPSVPIAKLYESDKDKLDQQAAEDEYYDNQGMNETVEFDENQLEQLENQNADIAGYNIGASNSSSVGQS